MDFGIEGGSEAACATTPTDAELETQLTRIQSSPEFDAPDRVRNPQLVSLRKPAQARASAASLIRSPRRLSGRTRSIDARTDPFVCACPAGQTTCFRQGNKSKGGET